MIARIQGKLEGIDDQRAMLTPAASGLSYEVHLPAFLAALLVVEIGKTCELITIEYFENQGNGSSYVPRLVGFKDAAQRDFFELLTSVSGIGNRKALRAMSQPPAVIARAIHERDAKLLGTLPEIGKRMAERLITELAGKVEQYLVAGGNEQESRGLSRTEVKQYRASRMPPEQEEAVLTMVALGQTRAEAEEALQRALARHRGDAPRSADQYVALIFAGARAK